MRCPQCGTRDTRVVDSRDLDDAATIRRRRECTVVRDPLHDLRARRGGPAGRRSSATASARSSIATSSSRPAQGADAPSRARRVLPSRPRTRSRRSCARAARPRCRRRGSARWRWTSCASIDQIAYIRFASVYQSFEDLEELKREVDTLYAERRDTGAAAAARHGGERPLGPRHPRRARGRARHASTRTTRSISSPRRSTSISTGLPRLPQQPVRVHRLRAPQPDLTELLTVDDDEPFILHPAEFVLGQTLEWVELPDDLVARLEGRSSWAGWAC